MVLNLVLEAGFTLAASFGKKPVVWSLKKSDQKGNKLWNTHFKNN